MDIELGQDEYKRAQSLSGGEDEFIPEGWEKMIDSGEFSKLVSYIEAELGTKASRILKSCISIMHREER